MKQKKKILKQLFNFNCSYFHKHQTQKVPRMKGSKLDYRGLIWGNMVD